MSCSVYDYIFKGWNQPLVGVFSIPIGELMHSLMAERKEETETIENICVELSKLLISDAAPVGAFALNDSIDNQSEYSAMNSTVDDGEALLGKSKSRKKAKKSMKKGQNSDSYIEPLGNEDDGVHAAKTTSDAQLAMARAMKSQLKSQVSSIKNNLQDQVDQ